MYNPTVVTKVVTPASSYNLIDLATLKTLLGVSDTLSDAYLTALIPIVSAGAAQYCNRVFAVETVTDTFLSPRIGYRLQRFGSTPPIQLTRWPVESISSVNETIAGQTSALVLDTDYMLDSLTAQLTRLDALGYPTQWTSSLVAVTYAGGLPANPPDIMGAMAAWIKAMRFAQQRDPALRSENLPGVYSASYVTSMASGMPVECSSVLDNYKSVLIG